MLRLGQNQRAGNGVNARDLRQKVTLSRQEKAVSFLFICKSSIGGEINRK